MNLQQQQHARRARKMPKMTTQMMLMALPVEPSLLSSSLLSDKTAMNLFSRGMNMVVLFRQVAQ